MTPASAGRVVTKKVAVVGQFVSVAFVFSVLLASAALLVPVELRVSYRRTHHDDHFYIEIKALGGLVYHKFVIPVWDFRIDQLLPYLRLKSETFESPGGQTSSLHHEHVIGSVDHVMEKFTRLRQRWEQYRPVLGLVLKHMSCTQFEWITQFGLGDAALTGIGTGFVWMIKGFVIALLRQHSRFDIRPNLTVRPVFSRSLFHTSFNCILRLHLGDIMVVRLLLVKKEQS